MPDASRCLPRPRKGDGPADEAGRRPKRDVSVAPTRRKDERPSGRATATQDHRPCVDEPCPVLAGEGSRSRIRRRWSLEPATSLSFGPPWSPGRHARPRGRRRRGGRSPGCGRPTLPSFALCVRGCAHAVTAAPIRRLLRGGLDRIQAFLRPVPRSTFLMGPVAVHGGGGISSSQESRNVPREVSISARWARSNRYSSCLT